MPDDKSDKPSKPAAVPIKIEPGRSSSSLVRLPSFRQPRDLTLGSGNMGRGGALGLGGVTKARKSYAPNLNVQRNKVKEEVKAKEETSKPRGERGRGRGDRARGDRGRGRGAPNVIQLSSGVFSEGIAASSRPGRSRAADDSSSYVPKPKLDLKQNYITDSKEENDRLRQLLQDDFVDDPDAAVDGIKPLQLPMIPMKKKGAHKNIKMEPGEEEEVNFKPMSEEEGHIVFERRVGDLLGSKEAEYLLVQLPDCLPGLKPSAEAEGNKNVNGTTSAPTGLGAEAKAPQCTLSSIPEGCIGKIQLLKSGRARLKLGSVFLPISMGTQVGFKQDLISINLDDFEKSGKMINLGQVRARVVVTPDWESLLLKA